MKTVQLTLSVVFGVLFGVVMALIASWLFDSLWLTIAVGMVCALFGIGYFEAGLHEKWRDSGTSWFIFWG
jgi:H+/Cl- antiporter ClcA